MPQMLNLTCPDVDSKEKRFKYTVGIVGCGQKGILFANAFAEAGYRVVCTDADPSVVKKVARGKTVVCEPEAESKLKSHITKGQISVISDLKKAVAQSDVLVIAFTVRVDDKKKTDASQTVNACKQVGAALSQGALIIYGGVSGVGFTEGTIKETLENTSGLRAGRDFGLAYSPIPASKDIELWVAANDQTSLQAASTILKTVTASVKEISNLKTAEVLTLFAAAKNDVNKALANELAAFCETANVDYFQILKMLAPNESSFTATMAREENRNEAYLLLESAENLNVKLRLPALARQINEETVKHAVNLTQEALRSCGKTLRRARVTVLGPVQQACASDIFVKYLELKGAKVTVYDPKAKKETSDTHLIKSSLNEAIEGADCLVVISTQERFNHLNLKRLKPLLKTPPVIVDLVGIFDPQELRTEGFIYCGLGRGTG